MFSPRRKPVFQHKSSLINKFTANVESVFAANTRLNVQEWIIFTSTRQRSFVRNFYCLKVTNNSWILSTWPCVRLFPVKNQQSQCHWLTYKRYACKVNNLWVLFQYFRRTLVFFVGPLEPCSQWTPGGVCPGFQSQIGPSALFACNGFPDSHSCDTCQSLPLLATFSSISQMEIELAP